jgi:predicted Fe-Mo cluster-binding NifX family protein
MEKKILIPIYEDEISPRFDLAAEALIVSRLEPLGEIDEKIVVLYNRSAEKLCHLILTEGIRTVICGGIEEEYYQYLVWKRVEVFDSIIGPWRDALGRYLNGELKTSDKLTYGLE